MPETVHGAEAGEHPAHDGAARDGVAHHEAATYEGGNHEVFDFAGALGHHNMPYPAWEPIHGSPLIIFNPAAYAARNFAHLSGHHMEAQFNAAEPAAGDAAWAKDYVAEKHLGLEPLALAKAMTVARHESVLGSFPQALSWVNQQTFWGTIALLLMAFVLLVVGKRSPGQVKPANKLQHMIEGIVIFVRDDIVRPNIHHGDEWVPHFTALFLALLSFNLIGLIPGTGTASGNAGVTTAFAITTFVAMLYFGIKEQGFGHFWISLSPVKFSWNPVDMILWPVLWLIELLGLFIKPTALSIRLFANMFAGHAVLLSFGALGMIIYAAQKDQVMLGFALGGVGWVASVAFFFLELLVAFVQAYVFTLLSAVFIGSAMHPSH